MRKSLTVVSGSPVSERVQLSPLFVDLNTPIVAPANRFVPLRASVYTAVSGRSLVPSAVQGGPLFVERRTLAPCVPAKRLAPLTANEVTTVSVNPDAVQVVSVLANL